MSRIFRRRGERPIVLLSLTLLATIASCRCPAAGTTDREAMIFTTTDQNPFIQIHSLPWPAEPAAARDEWKFSWTLDIANHAISGTDSDGEQVIIDGETWRAGLHAGIGVTERLSFGVLIPLVSHQRGIFDGPIRRWHDLVGLSNTRRDEFDDYSLSYIYDDPDGDGISVTQPGTGIGDIRVTSAWRLDEERRDDHQLTLRAGLKLPTGDADQLYGSGGTDLSLQLLGTNRRILSSWNMSLSWMAGALWLGDGDVLEQLRRDVVAVGSLGLVLPVGHRLQFKAQLDGHGSFYDTALDEIGSSSMQLVVGAGVRLAEGRWLDLGIVENLFTDTTPDFVIHFAVHTLL